MFWFSRYKFYDKNWNFNNSKILDLLNKAKKANSRKNKSAWFLEKEISLFNSVSRKEVWKFINSLSIFINSWIDIKWALNIIIKQIKNPYLKKIVEEIKTNIDYWIPISETMAQYPKIFDNLTIALIWVWEKTGSLGLILEEMDKKMIESMDLKAKVKSAMVYPFILLGLTFAMVSFMMIFVIPKLTSAFEKTSTELPALTTFVIWVSNFFIEKWYIMAILIFLFIAWIKIISETYIWKMVFWYISLKVPVFWYISKTSNIIYFISSFTLLLNSWVLLLECLKTSSNVLSNLLYRKEIIRIKDEVESGLTISKSLWLNNDYESNVYLNEYFPEEFAYVVNMWEETWSLSDSLLKLEENYTKELRRYISNLSTLLEPFIIVIVGLIVWIIVISVMLPFFELWKIVQEL